MKRLRTLHRKQTSACWFLNSHIFLNFAEATFQVIYGNCMIGCGDVTNTADLADGLIAFKRWATRIAVLHDLRIPTRKNNRLGLCLRQGVIHFPLVVRPIARKRISRRFDLFAQIIHLSLISVVAPVVRQYFRSGLLHFRVHRQVQLLPRRPLIIRQGRAEVQSRSQS